MPQIGTAEILTSIREHLMVQLSMNWEQLWLNVWFSLCVGKATMFFFMITASLVYN